MREGWLRAASCLGAVAARNHQAGRLVFLDESL